MVKKKIDKGIYFETVSTKGRPYLLINEEGKLHIEKLASYMCTDEEIASMLGVSVDVLTNSKNIETFSECKKKGIENGKSSLRRKQYEVAMNGNCTMLVWLGKQYLGQKEQVNAEVNGNGMLGDILEYMKQKETGD